MTTPGGKRYSDEEVGLVLKRAVELEARRTESGGRGQTLDEIKQIAAEVGIDAGLVERAAMSLDARDPALGTSLLGPGTTATAEALVPGTLDRSAQAELLSAVQAELGMEGIVTEALGSARWTHQSRAGATQVMLTPGGEGTRVEVLDRYSKRVPVVLHAVPAAWGAILGHTVAASLLIPGSTAALLILGGALMGGGLGRAVWEGLARRSRGKVRALLDRLTRLATARAGSADAARPSADGGGATAP